MRRFVLVLLLASRLAQAAFELQCFHPVRIAQGNILAQHAHGLNPAAIAAAHGLSCVAGHTRLYNLRDLQAWHAKLTWCSASRRQVTADYTAVGNPLYREQTFGLGYGRLVHPALALGARLMVYDLYVQDYQVEPTCGIALGAVFHPDTNYTIGLLLSNLNQPRLHSQPHEIPRSFTCGLRWHVQPRLELAGELYKDLDFPLTERIGFDWQICSFWHLLGGVQLNPDRFSLGTALSWHNLTLAVAVQQHLQLPLTLYWGVSWR